MLERDRLVAPGDGDDLVQRHGCAGQFHPIDPTSRFGADEPLGLAPMHLANVTRTIRATPSVYRKHFADCRRERQFLAAVSFL